jgi:hypothetical protein
MKTGLHRSNRVRALAVTGPLSYRLFAGEHPGNHLLLLPVMSIGKQ